MRSDLETLHKNIIIIYFSTGLDHVVATARSNTNRKRTPALRNTRSTATPSPSTSPICTRRATTHFKVNMECIRDGGDSVFVENLRRVEVASIEEALGVLLNASRSST